MNTTMREEDFDHLFRQLCNLQTEAPCHNAVPTECHKCAYCCYSGECAIDIIRIEANRKYKLLKEKQLAEDVEHGHRTILYF